MTASNGVVVFVVMAQYEGDSGSDYGYVAGLSLSAEKANEMRRIVAEEVREGVEVIVDECDLEAICWE